MRDCRSKRWGVIAAVAGVVILVGASGCPEAGVGGSGRKLFYSIGETGPGGGIVFYDKGAYSDGWRYLEAAPASTEWAAEWGGYETLVGGTGTDIGTGKANTQAIVTAYGDNEPYGGRDDYAAKLCADLEYGGKSDWFLPSRYELNQMYLQRGVIGGFASAMYWSSSEHLADYAWTQRVANGHQGASHKHYIRTARAARAF